MRQELENIQYIEKYLEDKLDFQEKQKFVQHLQENRPFKEALELQQQIVHQLKEEAFLQDIGAFHHQNTNHQNKSNFSGLKYIGLAIFLVLFLAILWMLNTPSKIGTDSEFTEQKSILISSNSQAESAIDSPLEIPARIQSLQTPYQTIRLNGAATLRLKGSNSILSIPKNALITPSGEPVKGSYELKYRLLNELSALAFHPIDLDYKTKDNSYRFGQAAIIDIQAFKEGDTLKIAPGKS